MISRTTRLFPIARWGRRSALVCFALFVGSLSIGTSDPGWWTDPATRIIDPAHTDADRGNKSPANLGQLKHVAAMAKAHLDLHLPGGAGPEIDALVAAFGSPQQADDDPYAPVLVGQLKSVAKPFYDRLMAFSFDTRGNLQANGLPPDWAHDYPWPPAPPAEGQPGYDQAIRAAWAEGNFAPALLGQLKLVFAFDLSAPAGQLPAWWVAHYFPGQTGITPGGDPDVDGLTNFEELNAGTHPDQPDSDGDGANDGAELAAYSSPWDEDSDNDGMWDGYEISNQLLAWYDDALSDQDGDGVPNLWEYAKLTQANDFNDVPPWDWIVDPDNADISATDNILGTIAEAIASVPVDNGNPAQSYQTIMVKTGTYPESVVIPADKRIAMVGEKSASPVKLIGENKLDHVLDIRGKSVVDGFWITRPASVARNASPTGLGVRAELPSGGQARIANTIVSGHRAAAAVISHTDGVIFLEHVTIANNHADAIWSYAGGVVVSNSILWNPDANNGEILGGVSAFNNIVRGGGYGIDEDPMLRPNGTLSPGSSAIDEAMDTAPVGLDIHGEEPNGEVRDIGADEWVDSDGDSLPDVWEWLVFSDLDEEASGHSDDDSLNNLEEFIYGTNPLSGDTDSDGMKDDWEATYNLDPNSSDENRNQTPDGSDDFDGDGISNAQEMGNGLDPGDGGETDPNQSQDADPDGDGESNVDEVTGYKTDPLQADCFIRMPEIEGFPLTPHGVPLPVPWDFYTRTFPVAEYPDVPTEEETEGEAGEGTKASVFVRFNSGPFVVDDDFLINDQPVVSLNFGERGKIFNVTEMWNTGSDKVAKGISTFFGNAFLETYRIVYLLPIELRDIKKHSVSSDDVQIPDWDTSQNIKPENIAWIEPHLAANDAPQMPQLEFAVPDMPSGWTVEAKLEVKYDRGNGARTSRNQTEDTVKFPSDGSFKQVSGNTWQIWSEYQNEDFFGGDAIFTFRIKSGTTTILPDTVIDFRIGGKNPDDAKCKAYIQGQPDAGPQGSLWFAYAIAKHESRGKNSSAGIDLYNQFYELPIHVNDVGRPTWNNDGSALPGGYGVFQITGSPTDATANIPRKQIWDWRDNVTGFFAIMNHDIKKGLSSRFYADIRNDSTQHDAAFIACPPPDIPVGSHTFPSDEAIWLTAYNGWGGPVKNRYVFDPNKPCGLGSDKRWHWNPPIKASGKTYIQLVEEEVD